MTEHGEKQIIALLTKISEQLETLTSAADHQYWVMPIPDIDAKLGRIEQAITGKR